MRGIKILLLAVVISVSGLMGCASAKHENVSDHHHHEQEKKPEFDGKCAYSVSNENFDVAGNPEFSLVHNGVTYYFSSKEAQNKFSAHKDESVKKAKKAWQNHGIRDR